MPDNKKTAAGPVLRRREALGFAAALAGFGAALGMGSSEALAGPGKRPAQWSTPDHRPYPGMEPSRFQTKQYVYHGPVSLNHH
jgi:hypothetical protein